MEITHIAIHNSGGLASSPYASTRHITPEQINAYHKEKWNYPSKHIPNSYGGYNFFYSPVTRKFTQFRAIGEETMAQRGWNFNTISLCIGGNYTAGAHFKPVDEMTETMEKDIAEFTLDLISGNHNWVVAPNTTINLSITRVHPHRWYQNSTECYGSGLSNNWIRDILAKYKKKPDTQELEQRIVILKQLLALYLRLLSFRDGGRLKAALGASDDGCSGNLPNNI